MSFANTQIQQHDQEPNRKADLTRHVRELDFEIAAMRAGDALAADLPGLRAIGRWLDTVHLRTLQKRRELTNALAKAA
jgi:hypothetical protein